MQELLYKMSLCYENKVLSIESESGNSMIMLEFGKTINANFIYRVKIHAISSERVLKLAV